MGISLSILLIAAGAVLAWAVDTEVSGLDITGGQNTTIIERDRSTDQT